MKKFVILLAVGLFLVMGVVQAGAKGPKFPNLVGAKFVGTGTFADAVTGLFTTAGAAVIELDIITQQDNLFTGSFMVNVSGTAVTIPVAGEMDHKDLRIVGPGIVINADLHDMRKKGTEVLGDFRVIDVQPNLSAGFGTFDLFKQ